MHWCEDQAQSAAMEPDPDEHVYPGHEDIRWGSGINDKERKKGSTPSAKYSKVSEQARRLIAGEGQCAMFCGGKKCKYCTSYNWKPEQMAIKGLYSEWVTDNILAMARPSNHGFETMKILEQFQEANIKTVINLQQPGEHASCGYGNDSSGFSYNPHRLMDRGIFFYNFAWLDYGIAPMSTLLDIVKVMQFGVSMGKVAVHCHAGLGRTGLLIACYLVYNNRMSATEAVHYVRSRRAGAIQTSQQVQTVCDFETHLKPFWTIFPSKIPGAVEVTLKHFLNRQSHLLHGFEARRLKHIPKVVYMCCERLLELAGRGQALSKIRGPVVTVTASAHPVQAGSDSGQIFQSSFSPLTTHSASNLQRLGMPEKARSSISFEDLNNTRFKQILAEGKDDCSKSSGSMDVISSHVDPTAARGEVSASISNIEEKSSEEDDDDDCIVFGRPDPPAEKSEDGQTGQAPNDASSCQVFEESSKLSQSHVDAEANHLSSDQSSSGSKSGQLPSEEVDVESTITSNGVDSNSRRKGKKKRGLKERLKALAKKPQDVKGTAESVASSPDQSSAIAVSKDSKEKSYRVCCYMVNTEEYPANVWSKADRIETLLNETDTAWGLLAQEEDPRVLSAIYWDWLNQLKEPVLKRQDLPLLLEWEGSPRECLHHLEKCVKHFIEYQALVLSKLFPQPQELETCLAERLLSHLTHEVVSVQFTSNHNQPTHWGEMKSSESRQLIEFFFKLISEVASSR